MEAINIASAGLMAAATRFDASARRTAQAPLEDLAGEIVERITAEIDFKANAHVIKAADEMAGTLLDVLA